MCRRNTTLFTYQPFLGLIDDVDERGYHTGEHVPAYGASSTYRGTISAPSGSVVMAFDGLEEQYTHTIIMDTPNTEFTEDGLIEWKGDKYSIVAIRPSLNFTIIAIRKQRSDHDIPITSPEGEEE